MRSLTIIASGTRATHAISMASFLFPPTHHTGWWSLVGTVTVSSNFAFLITAARVGLSSDRTAKRERCEVLGHWEGIQAATLRETQSHLQGLNEIHPKVKKHLEINMPCAFSLATFILHTGRQLPWVTPEAHEKVTVESPLIAEHTSSLPLHSHLLLRDKEE